MQSQSLVIDNRKDFKDEVKELTQAAIEDRRQNDGLMQVNPLREETKKELESQIKEFLDEMKRLRKINRSWDAGLTITTIVLT